MMMMVVVMMMMMMIQNDVKERYDGEMVCHRTKNAMKLLFFLLRLLLLLLLLFSSFILLLLHLTSVPILFLLHFPVHIGSV